MQASIDMNDLGGRERQDSAREGRDRSTDVLGHSPSSGSDLKPVGDAGIIEPPNFGRHVRGDDSRSDFENLDASIGQAR